MGKIERERLRARLGTTNSTIRKWVKDGLVVRADGGKGKLGPAVLFSENALSVRTAFILAADKDSYPRVAEVLTNELGADDGNLADMLTGSTPRQVVEDIANRHSLSYSLKKIEFFMLSKAE